MIFTRGGKQGTDVPKREGRSTKIPFLWKIQNSKQKHNNGTEKVIHNHHPCLLNFQLPLILLQSSNPPQDYARTTLFNDFPGKKLSN